MSTASDLDSRKGKVTEAWSRVVVIWVWMFVEVILKGYKLSLSRISPRTLFCSMVTMVNNKVSHA